MRVLLGAPGREVSADDLLALYAAPRTPWLRVNMVATVDGAAPGEDGRSGSINNAADGQVFAALRRLSDAVLVGAGTAEAEGYRPLRIPLVLVSRRGTVPPLLRDGSPGRVWLATCGSAPGLRRAREVLGEEHVLVCGDDAVDLPQMVESLAGEELAQVLCEGGPHLLGDLLVADLVDELCATVVPRAVVGEHPRITTGAAVDRGLTLGLLLEHEGTLLARWRRER